MQLTQIRNFIAAVESGSLREAGRRLGISQPALTKSIKALEASVGAPLFFRGAHGVKLTEPGSLFYARARVVHVELKRAEDEIADLALRGRGRVSLGIASVVGALLVPQMLTRLQARRSGIEVRVVEGTQETLLPLLREGAIDLAACLKLDSESLGGFSMRPLAKVKLVVAARHGHPLAGIRSLQELQSCLWAGIRPRGGSGMLEHAYRLEGLEPPASRLQCDSLGIQLAILAETDAVGFMARQMLQRPAVQSVLAEIRVRRPLPLLTIGLYRREDVQLTRAAGDLAQALTLTARDVLRTP